MRSSEVDARPSDGSPVQTRFLCALFTQLLSDPVEVPAIWDAFQFVGAAVIKGETGSGYEIFDGA